MVLGKTPESTLESKIKLINPKGHQPWILFGRTDAEGPLLWPPDANSWFSGKDPDAGKDWRQKEKKATEDEIVRWHHQFNGHELGQTAGDGEGKGSLVCCSPCGHEELNVTWWLNNSNPLRNQDLAPKLHYYFSAAPPLSLNSFPSLVSTCPLELSEGHAG